MTVNEALRSVNAYPIPRRTIAEVCERRGLDPCGEAAVSVLGSAEFKLAKADLLLWLSYAPNVSQGGQSYSLSDEQRQNLRNEAAGLYGGNAEANEDGQQMHITYGYKGNRL
jgi:hypothetical protein